MTIGSISTTNCACIVVQVPLSRLCCGLLYVAMPHSPRSTTGSGRTFFPIGCKAAMWYNCIDMHIARSRSPIKCRKRRKRTCGGVISLAPRRAPHAFDSGTTLTSCPEYDPYLQHAMNCLKHHYHQQHSHNMRGFRGQGQAYMPPHASDRAGPLQAARTLGDIEFPTLYWQVGDTNTDLRICERQA